MNFFKNKKGFTLVELVVVIAILGILAGIAIPRFMDATASARGAKIVADLRTLESASTMYYVKKGSYTDISVANLVSENLLATTPVAPTGDAIIPGSTSATYSVRFAIPTTDAGYKVVAAKTDNKIGVDNGVTITCGGIGLSTYLGS